MKAVQHWEHELRIAPPPSAVSIFDQALWAFRCAFFRDCRDIACWDVQCEVASAVDVDIAAIERIIHNGSAFASLAADYQDADTLRIEAARASC